MGLGNLFKNIGKAASAKAQNAADKIDAEHSVDFAKQEIQQMKDDLGAVIGNIGSIKGEYAVLQDKIKGLKADVKKHEEDAKDLSESGNDKLALAHCEAIEKIEPQLEALNMAAKQQKDLLDDQIGSKDELKNAIDQAEAQLITLKAMEDVTSANEKITKIGPASTSSAMQRFAERQEEAKKRLTRSQAIKDESKGDTSLEDETKKALGKSAAADRLAKLKGK